MATNWNPHDSEDGVKHLYYYYANVFPSFNLSSDNNYVSHFKRTFNKYLYDVYINKNSYFRFIICLCV